MYCVEVMDTLWASTLAPVHQAYLSANVRIRFSHIDHCALTGWGKLAMQLT